MKPTKSTKSTATAAKPEALTKGQKGRTGALDEKSLSGVSGGTVVGKREPLRK